MNYKALRPLLLPGVLLVAATTGLASAAQIPEVFTYACEIRRSNSGAVYDVTYHIDLTSKTYTASHHDDPNKRYQIDSVRDDGSIRLFRNVDSKGYAAGTVLIYPEKGTYSYFLQDHNFQVKHYGTCTVTE